ncbi:MAG: cupin domain-containing protein [Cyanobacteriota bacterium]
MSEILVQRPKKDQLDKLNVDSWSTWECEVSDFDWEYSDEEVCYFLEGLVLVETEEERVEIHPGDLVTFPKGLQCRWHVLEPVRKVYKFNY